MSAEPEYDENASPPVESEPVIQIERLNKTYSRRRGLMQLLRARISPERSTHSSKNALCDLDLRVSVRCH